MTKGLKVLSQLTKCFALLLTINVASWVVWLAVLQIQDGSRGRVVYMVKCYVLRPGRLRYLHIDETWWNCTANRPKATYVIVNRK